ncbi:hypothetical protein QYE76_032975 [Lolium multiflorum]|uniref:Uncharacterized protein n=1 Tax=Lolium multiflorum TaxID=4521 RepID=A0AAD8VIV8_LOLMU|nr:hypothetical protein QYE76_032975 [Lolium multiflorum]
MARLAIWFSAGQCVAFMGEHGCVDGDLLLFLAERAPLLKTLRLPMVYHHNQAFVEAIKKFPMLEELEFCQCKDRNVTWIIRTLVTCSLQLRHLKYVNRGGYLLADNRDALEIARMHGLSSLQLFYCNLDNKGLTTIIDNCPHLESLHLHYCANVVIDSSMQTKCARIKTKKLYPYVYNDFTKYFEPGDRTSPCSTFRIYRNYGDEVDFQYLYAEDHDSADYDHSCYFSRAGETDFEEQERSFINGTRRRRHRYLRI